MPKPRPPRLDRMATVKDYIRHLHTVHINSLNEHSQMAEVSETLVKVGLHSHQKAVLARMDTMEKEMNAGMVYQDERIFSNYGILGDSVGSGKSLMVLAHIARLEALMPIQTHNSIHGMSNSTFFSMKTQKFSDISEVGSLIIVPHTLFRQWSDYITKQTNLKHFCIARGNQIDAERKWVEKVQAAQVVLISNTLYNAFARGCFHEKLKWKRVFIDEADTIRIAGSYGKEHIPSRFTWLITASWVNLLYLNSNLYFDRNYITDKILGPDSLPEYAYLKPHFKSRVTSHSYYIIEKLYVASTSFLKGILNYGHPFRSSAVITCSSEFIQKSISLPPLYRKIVWCREPRVNQIVRDAVPQNIRDMLNAGDTKSALEQLGVKGQDASALIQAVTGNLLKELDRLEKTYLFKASLEYATPQAKDAALKALKEKIDRAKVSIASLKERIQNFETETCPICYEEPTEHLVTPCCSRVFCAACLLMSMSRNPECPLCRGKIHPSSCTKLIIKKPGEANEIVTGAEASPEGLLNKNQTLLTLLNENPKGKFLIFSKYENTFETIEQAVDENGISVRNLKGSKDNIASTLRQFEDGKIRCLLLNSRFAGSGLNITAATHVVLLHAMTHEEEKQILGRAYRSGRRGPLEFIKLLNKDEETYVGEDAVTDVDVVAE